MKVGLNPTARIHQLEIPFWHVMEPPIRKLGEPIKQPPIFAPPSDWPVIVLGGPCEGEASNPHYCRKTATVDTGCGLFCAVCSEPFNAPL